MDLVKQKIIDFELIIVKPLRILIRVNTGPKKILIKPSPRKFDDAKIMPRRINDTYIENKGDSENRRGASVRRRRGEGVERCENDFRAQKSANRACLNTRGEPLVRLTFSLFFLLLFYLLLGSMQNTLLRCR